MERPSGDRARVWHSDTIKLADSSRLEPHARAYLHSPARSPRTARCRADREEEQAVSMLTTGPEKPITNAIRPAPKHSPPPVV